jgi:hypothetical protein
VHASETRCTLRESRNIEDLGDMLTPYRNVMSDLFRLGVNTPVLILKVLNRLPLAEVHNPIAELMSIESPEWNEIVAKLSGGQ